jgi:membrane protein YqaA with SNARE-associated domain
MRHLSEVLFTIFWKFGGPGLLVIGILDSSFIFAPVANDLLVVAMTARHRDVPQMLYYSAMSTIGSMLGCLLVDAIFRKAGEKGLEKHLGRRRLEYVRRKVTGNAAWALAVASIAPPPFPFTPFVMAAAALQYPRKRMLAVVGAARMVRFTTLGILALIFGRRMLRLADNDAVRAALVAFFVLCAVGSVVSVYGWIKRSRSSRSPARESRGDEPAPPVLE